MASVVLTNIGNTIGSKFLGSAMGSTIGSALGGLTGQALDNLLLGSKDIETQDNKLEKLNVQSSTYGRFIPIVYGQAKLSGNIIWASKINEHSNVTTRNTGGKTSRIKHHHTSYSYSISLAIAICEGEILSLERIWANDILLNIDAYKIRLYKGTENQDPDPVIEREEGIESTPAYRGLAYVVFEDLNLSEFGNRLPNFSFEVISRAIGNSKESSLEKRIEAVVMIPGSGEVVYDTIVQHKVQGSNNHDVWIQSGPSSALNRHSFHNISNSVLSLNQLQTTLPNIQWIAPVVGWFGTDLDIAKCDIFPGVEFKVGGAISPEEWGVAGYRRDNAYLISQIDQKVSYGGSPSDNGFRRYLQEIKNRGIKIMLIPMVFMDIPNKPWRGRLTGQPEKIKEFFNKSNGYKRFILHYANLCKDLVDCFLIGSELIGITKIKTIDNEFPAIDELCNLAQEVRKVLGPNVKISYAADWSEYHHTDGGWYNLDKLWSCPAIDFIGIDAYFPLTSHIQGESLSVEKIRSGWDKGELQEFYFDDGKPVPLSPEWALKNIEHWWSSEHHNPNGENTGWIPKSKKIWFTELGFPSVDNSTNQPNVFFDASSSESNFPTGSSGSIDFAIQRKALIASLQKWDGSNFVENKFIWTWDARPYPYWPMLKNVWSDADNWSRGHWIQGKLSTATLGGVIQDLCKRAGLDEKDIDIHSLNGDLDQGVTGLVITEKRSIDKLLKELQLFYDFVTVELDSKICFRSKNSALNLKIDIDDLLPIQLEKNSFPLRIQRAQNHEIINKISINYIDKYSDYRIKNKLISGDLSSGAKSLLLNIPIIATDNEINNIGRKLLIASEANRNLYTLMLPIHYINLIPGDLIDVKHNETNHRVRITDVDIGNNNCLLIKGFSEEFEILDSPITNELAHIDINNIRAETKMELLDIPEISGIDINAPKILLACYGDNENWAGAKVYYHDKYDGTVNEVATVYEEATCGTAVDAILPTNPYLFDKKNSVEIHLINGQLHSIKEEFFNGGNLAIIGDEIIQFKTAKLIGPNKYIIQDLRRGLFGTESKVSKHKVNERFILLDQKIVTVKLDEKLINRDIDFYVLTLGQAFENKKTIRCNFSANNLKPLSPIHIKLNKDNILSWIRRNRGDYSWKDFTQAAVNENGEIYYVKFGEDSQNQIITVTGKSSLDCSTISNLLRKSIRISQVSSKVGPGYYRAI